MGFSFLGPAEGGLRRRGDHQVHLARGARFFRKSGCFYFEILQGSGGMRVGGMRVAGGEAAPTPNEAVPAPLKVVPAPLEAVPAPPGMRGAPRPGTAPSCDVVHFVPQNCGTKCATSHDGAARGARGRTAWRRPRQAAPPPPPSPSPLPFTEALLPRPFLFAPGSVPARTYFYLYSGYK